MTRANETLDGETFGPWSVSDDGSNQKPLIPRLRVLFHIDSHRIGAVSQPGTPLGAGEWQMVGRATPKFFSVACDDEVRIDDPTISRKQLRIRWRPDLHRFEVEPMPGVRRRVWFFEPFQSTSENHQAQEITGRVELVPGSSITIDDRLMLGLELIQRSCFLEEDRLGLIGESPQMWQLRDELFEVAMFKRPTLILGPTGSGKELVAHAIHQQSARANAPFVIANCAALSEHLIESLLFGHTKGAFTGAISTKQGLFRAAHEGTLFLDEIGEFSIGLQPKLLRVLQDGVVTPVGQTEGTSVDVHVIAATHRDPAQDIANGRLREDLYHRLSSHIIRVPSLNDRVFDVSELFARFFERFAQPHPKSHWIWERARRWKKTIPLRFFVKLMRGDWSGNVRQLENVAAQTVQLNLRGKPFRAPVLPLQKPTSVSGLGSVQSEVMSTTSSPSVPKLQGIVGESQHLARASQLLTLAHKTVGKLFDAAALAALWREVEATHGALDDSVLKTALEDTLEKKLFALMHKNGFKTRPVAMHLKVSPATFIKLVQRFGFQRPSDLSLEAIEAALAQAKGDVTRAAFDLRVSRQGLQRRLTQLNESK